MRMQSLLVTASLLALAACAAPPPPDYAAQHQPALDAFMAGWNAGDLDGLDAAVAIDFVRRSPGGMTAQGRDAIKAVMTDLRAGYPDMKVVLDESHFMQDVSFHLWTFTGTNTGPGAMPPSGKFVTNTGATLIRYKEGMIAEEIVHFDVLAWQLALGYTLAPPAGEEVAAQ